MKQNEETTKDGGYICLFRKFLNWEWYDDANTMRLFLHCLLSANHKENKCHGIVVKQGSFITSIPKLANSLKLSGQQIRTALNKLKSTGEITHETTSQYSVISIKNWVTYQKNNRQNNRRITYEQQTDNSQITINNNDNNENKEKNDNKSICIQLLDFLNLKTGYKYQYTDTNIKLIKARLKDFTKEDLMQMIDYKVKEWINDDKMKQYLRPQTLFCASKCENYVVMSKSSSQQKVDKQKLIELARSIK